jgi:hypothetical protein
MAKHTDVFLRHEVDLATFATLTEQVSIVLNRFRP